MTQHLWDEAELADITDQLVGIDEAIHRVLETLAARLPVEQAARVRSRLASAPPTFREQVDAAKLSITERFHATDETGMWAR